MSTFAEKLAQWEAEMRRVAGLRLAYREGCDDHERGVASEARIDERFPYPPRPERQKVTRPRVVRGFPQFNQFKGDGCRTGKTYALRVCEDKGLEYAFEGGLWEPMSDYGLATLVRHGTPEEIRRLADLKENPTEEVWEDEQ